MDHYLVLVLGKSLCFVNSSSVFLSLLTTDGFYVFIEMDIVCNSGYNLYQF
jgi:hypothetical protein